MTNGIAILVILIMKKTKLFSFVYAPNVLDVIH